MRHYSKLWVLIGASAMVHLLGPAASKAAVITTTFADNNNYTGNFFDITTGSQAIDITGMSVNVDPGTMVIDVYDKSGTYVGNDTDPTAFTLVSQTAVVGLGEGTPTPVAITPFTLPANSLEGLYVTIDSNVDAAPFMYYTDGSNIYSNADLSIATGEGSGGLFGSQGIFPGRTWNGSFTYNTHCRA